MQQPHSSHFDAAHRILCYLKYTIENGIFLPASSSFQLVGYTDSDWDGCPTTRRSTTGYFAMLGSIPISCKTKKQTTIFRSSVEAEYHALAALTSETQWFKYLLKDID